MRLKCYCNLFHKGEKNNPTATAADGHKVCVNRVSLAHKASINATANGKQPPFIKSSLLPFALLVSRGTKTSDWNLKCHLLLVQFHFSDLVNITTGCSPSAKNILFSLLWLAQSRRQDVKGSWHNKCLHRRSGKEHKHYPVGQNNVAMRADQAFVPNMVTDGFQVCGGGGEMTGSAIMHAHSRKQELQGSSSFAVTWFWSRTQTRDEERWLLTFWKLLRCKHWSKGTGMNLYRTALLWTGYVL